jgi:hypothetical protein
VSAADLDRVMAEQAREREQLTAALAAAQAAKDAADRGARWTVVQQYGHLPDKVISTHRWAWLAEWQARRADRRDTPETPETRAHYTVRRAAS